MANPYAVKGSAQVWRTAIADRPYQDVEPIRAKRIPLADGGAVATAGSCFAQNLARHLKANGRLRLLEVEPAREGQPLFSARYGNVYTARQLVQLFDRAFGRFDPADVAWRRPDGAYVDCFRPFMFGEGFGSVAEVSAERDRHLAAVQRVFTECSVFIFTLGLTEGWLSLSDGAAFPVAPGVVNPDIPPRGYAFRNFTYEDVLADLEGFIARMKDVNPPASIVLTVSPVPLTATYTDEHVLVATAHSKAILRAVCGAVDAGHPQVFYFPAYEIIAGHHTRGAYFNENLRTVTTAGVDHVMRVFDKTFVAAGPPEPAGPAPRPRVIEEAVDEVICDDDEIERSVGF